jgi:hypothetical protein
MPQSPTDILSVITVDNIDGMILSILFSREKKFWPRFVVCKTVGGWFFLFLIESAMEWGITEDQYSDG